MEYNWYIMYNEDITEELFLEFISKLKELGYKDQLYCRFDISYSTFKKHRYLRSGSKNEHYTEFLGIPSFCIDNNSQSLERKEIEYFLKKESNYEIY